MSLICCNCGEKLGPDVECALVSAVDPEKSSGNAQQSLTYQLGIDKRGTYQWTRQVDHPIITGNGVYICAECLKAIPSVYQLLFMNMKVKI